MTKGGRGGYDDSIDSDDLTFRILSQPLIGFTRRQNQMIRIWFEFYMIDWRVTRLVDFSQKLRMDDVLLIFFEQFLCNSTQIQTEPNCFVKNKGSIRQISQIG